jgi:hypothetical protein
LRHYAIFSRRNPPYCEMTVSLGGRSFVQIRPMTQFVWNKHGCDIRYRFPSFIDDCAINATAFKADQNAVVFTNCETPPGCIVGWSET